MKFTSPKKKGVFPVIEFLEDKREPLFGAVAADRVVGTAAAYLFIKGGISAVYGDVMSESAVSVLKTAGVPFSYGTLVPHIKNRRGDGLCPMEELCMNLDNPSEAYKKIKDFIGK